MATRLRHKIGTGMATIVVLMALSASAWLAYASSAPNGIPSYQGGGNTTTTRPATTQTTAPQPTVTTAGPSTPTTRKHTATTVDVGGEDTTNTTAGTVATDPGDDDNLPFTGAQTAALAAFGLACVGAGAALLYRRRQRA
jgi:LPXTG-motif cell wall-anchored protein